MSHQYIANAKGQKIAYFYHQGSDSLPIIIFCGGYKSDMMGSKATYLEQQAKKRNQSYIRFDYTGHGFSDGKFEEGTISDWRDDALCVIDQVAKGDILLVGSSMGGWISLLCAIRRAGRIKGLIGLAAAPDFTKWMYNDLNDQQKQQIEDQGYTEIPNDYSDEPYICTRELLDDGAENYVLYDDKPTPLDIPIYLLQGMRDEDVPWQTAIKISEHVQSHDVHIELIKDGDHRVSRPQDLERINAAIEMTNHKIKA